MSDHATRILNKNRAWFAVTKPKNNQSCAVLFFSLPKMIQLKFYQKARQHK